MIVPINIAVREYQEGQKVLLIKELNCDYVMFTVGHEFTVIEKVPKYSSYRLIDNENDIIVKVEPNFFTLKTELKEAKRICIDIREKAKVIEFIKNHCPQKDYGYDDRDRYDTCKLKEYHWSGGGACECKLSCINYIKKEDIDKDSFIKTYMRKIKIKEVTK